jgi:hypothetical protein
MQMATSAYACPSIKMNNLVQIQMVNCDGMDEIQTTLCHISLKNPYKKQSLDKPLTPDVSEFLIVGLVFTVYENETDIISVSSIPEYNLKRMTTPPLAIRHCCFLI